MTTDDNITDDEGFGHDDDHATTPGDRRPLGYWLRTVDALLTREFATAFEGEGVTRREWMLLNLLSGDIDAPGAAERLARKGKRLRRLEDLGWAEEQGDGTWALTDEGRAARERLAAVVDGIRSRVSGAVSPEDYATTMASLEAIARELGWDEASGFPRGRGFGRWGQRFGGPRPFRPEIRFGFGPNLHHGFEPWRPGADPRHGEHGHPAHGHGFPGHPGHGFPGHHPHGGHGGHGHGHGHGRRKAERAYERGFAAGFGAATSSPGTGPEASGTSA